MTSLLERFAPLLAEIAAGAVRRELDRELPFAEVKALREAGFGRARVPVVDGGLGASFPEFVDLLIALAAADSNLPQLLRGHIGFVERTLWLPAGPDREFWLAELAGGALVGNAQSEPTGAHGEQATRIEQGGRGWRVSGRKFYSTGSLFADWILVSSRSAGEMVVAVVPARAPGVTRTDDWDGFGQRLTGSGTTVFDDVAVEAAHVTVVAAGEQPVTAQQAVLQLVHLATLAGIADRVVTDAVELVRGRSRAGHFANVATPRADPQVQQVIGELAAGAFGAAAAVRAAARTVGEFVGKEAPTGHDQAVAEAAVYTAQLTVIDQTLQVTSDAFRVGGASAVARDKALDRHWRNARTISSHNPEIHKARVVGEWLLDGTEPQTAFVRSR